MLVFARKKSMLSQRAKTGRDGDPVSSLRELSVPLVVKERTCFGNDLGRFFYFTGGDKTSFVEGTKDGPSTSFAPKPN